MANPLLLNVRAPSPLAPTVGLLGTVRPISEPDPHFEGGITFVPEGCMPVGTADAFCGDPLTREASDFAAVVSSVPALAWTAGVCSTLGGIPRAELGGRIAANLDRVIGKQVEAELWTGAHATGVAVDNLYLAGGSPGFVNLSPDPSDVSPGAYALAALQAFLADCADAGRGMIHASRNVVTMWQERNLLRRDGTVILDLYDNFVVAGAGYPGTDPDGDEDTTGETSWAYATGLVDVRLGAVQYLPALDDIAAALDRGRNDLTYVVQRAFSATWDGCCHAGVRVGVCETCCSPTGS